MNTRIERLSIKCLQDGYCDVSLTVNGIDLRFEDRAENLPISKLTEELIERVIRGMKPEG